MASNRFFDDDGLSVVDGTTAKASQLNSVTNETSKAFDLLESELDGISIGALLSLAWAQSNQGIEPDPVNYPDTYSSKAYALEAMAWVDGNIGVDTRADGTTVIPYTAKDQADKSKDSADAAARSIFGGCMTQSARQTTRHQFLAA